MTLLEIEHIEWEIPEGMAVPEYRALIQQALRELVNKYPDYENSWQRFDADWYYKRLSNELKEFKSAMTWPSKIRKLANIVNLCAMARTNILASGEKLQ